MDIFKIGAGDGFRTHDNHVGNVVLYQLSYTRVITIFIIFSREMIVLDYYNTTGFVKEIDGQNLLKTVSVA